MFIIGSLNYRSLSINTFKAEYVLMGPFPKKRTALQFCREELRKLKSIRRSRMEERRRTQRAAFPVRLPLLVRAIRRLRSTQVSRSTVVLCLQNCLAFGLDAALAELPRPGKPRGNCRRCHGLGAALCVPEARGIGVFLRTMDLQAVNGSCAPARRRRRTSSLA